MQVAGVDGCLGGWIVVEFDDQTGVLSCSYQATFRGIISSTVGVACIGIDIPIGLTDGPPRACDLAARAILGKRQSSVFPAPIRQILDASDHRTASADARGITGKGISIQAFNITAKVAEVDAVLRANPGLQGFVIEVHPEVSFRALNGGTPMSYSKKRTEGFSERSTLLAAAFHLDQIPASRTDARHITPYAGPDDLLDAMVACWTAHRFARGLAGRLPDEPARDRDGLWMEIVY